MSDGLFINKRKGVLMELVDSEVFNESFLHLELMVNRLLKNSLKFSVKNSNNPDHTELDKILNNTQIIIWLLNDEIKNLKSMLYD